MKRPSQSLVEASVKTVASRRRLDGSLSNRRVSSDGADAAAASGKVMLPGILIGVVMAALLSAATARAQSIYSSPAPFITIAGTAGDYGYADGTNGDALFYRPQGIAEDIHGNLYVADGFENTIRRLTPVGTNWVVTTIAGTPNPSATDVDGTNGAAGFDDPAGLAVDTNGNIYVGEDNGATIRKVTPVGTNWVVTTIAGQPENYGSADGTNTAALFNGKLFLTVDTHSNLYVADTYNDVIRKITPVGTNWVVTTIAGQPGTYGYADGTNSAATFDEPFGIALDAAGNLYVADYDVHFGGATIRKMTPSGTNWVVTTIAGMPTITGSEDGTNQTALFGAPYGLTADSVGDLYVADYGYHTIRKLTPSGTNWVVSTIAGVAGQTGSSDGTGTNALFYAPWGVVADGAGNLFVTDYLNANVRQGQVTVAVTVPNPTIQFIGPNTVQVTWPDTGSFVLQTNGDLTTPQWADYGGPVTTTNGISSVTIVLPPSGILFFRLAAGTGGTVSVPNLSVGFALSRVEVSWPATGSFTLQTNADLATTNWGDYGGTITATNGAYRAAFTPSGGTLFFRLRQ